jgi:LPPG:FO 2-phospho-L-lactate transferase
VTQGKVALLAGGTGGGKLAAGLQDLLGPELAVIVNTADDVELHGLYVSVDPDLVTFWLAGVIDEQRGYGFADDAFVVHEHLERLGTPGWFALSDRDLATSLYRTHFLAEGGTLSAAQEQIARALGVRSPVLPMSDDPVRTFVDTAAGRRGLQEFLILDHGEGEVRGVELEGIESAAATPQVLEALASAETILIAPSNPVISIGPILALAGVRETIESSPAPTVAVSPLVAGRSLKGPTEAFLRGLGRPVSAAGVASLYEGLLAGMVIDPDEPEPPRGPELLRAPTVMSDAAARRALAARTLDFARGL